MAYHIDSAPTNPKSIRRAERKRIEQERSTAKHNAILQALAAAGYKACYTKWKDSWTFIDSEGSNGGISFEHLTSAMQHFLPGKLEQIDELIDAEYPQPS